MSADQTNSAGPPNRLRFRIRAQEHEEYEFEAAGTARFVRHRLRDFLFACGLPESEELKRADGREVPSGEAHRPLDRAEGAIAGLETAKRAGEPEAPDPAPPPENVSHETSQTAAQEIRTFLKAPAGKTASDAIRRELSQHSDRWYHLGELREALRRSSSQISASLVFLCDKGEVVRREMAEERRYGRARWEFRWAVGAAAEDRQEVVESPAAKPNGPGGLETLTALAAGDGKLKVAVRWTGKVAVAILPDGTRLERRGPRDAALAALNANVLEVLKSKARQEATR